MEQKFGDGIEGSSVKVEDWNQRVTQFALHFWEHSDPQK